VILDGNFADAKITKNTDGSFKIVTAGGTTTVANVELFQFADGTKTAGDLIPVTTLELTAGIDTLVGTALDETIVGLPLSNFGTFDSVDGGDGKDTMSLTSTSETGEVLSTLATVKNVEALTVADAGGSFTADVSGWAGLTSVGIAQGIDTSAGIEAVTVTTKNNVTSVSLTLGASAVGNTDAIVVTDAGTTADALASVSISGYSGYDVDLTSDALTSLTLKGANDLDVTIDNAKAHALTLTIDGSGSATGGENVVSDDTATSVAITASTTTDASKQQLSLDVSEATSVTVGGAGAITITEGLGFQTDLAKVVTFDASTNTGGVVLLEELSTEAVFTGGTGDDTLTVNSMFTGTGSANGGAGTDTLAMNVYAADILTADSKFAAKIDGFEAVSLSAVLSNTSATVDIANLDNVSTVTSAGTSGSLAVREIQTLTITNGGDADGGQIVIFGVAIDVAPNATQAQVAQAIFDAEADLLAANPNLVGLELDGNEVTFRYDRFAGNQGDVTVTDDDSGATFSGVTTQTNGANEVKDVDTITVGNAVTASGFYTVTIGSTNIAVSLINGMTAAQAALAITNAINADTTASALVTATVAGGVVTITADGAGNVNVVGTDTDSVFTTDPVVANNNGYAAATAETQYFYVTGAADSDGGSVLIGGVRVDIAPGATIDQIGSAIASAEADIIAGNSNIASVNYDTATDKVTVVYIASAGDIATDISTGDNTASGVTSSVFTNQQGVPGVPGGELYLDNFVNGGTFVLTGANGEYTEINVKDALTTGNDVVNVVLKGTDGFDSDGWMQISNVSTLNFKTVDTNSVANTHDFQLFVGAQETTTVNVEGVSGIDFGDWGDSELYNVKTFDASKVTGTGSVGAVHVALGYSNGVTATGGAGDDTIWSNSASLKVDKLSGGAGNDELSSWDGNDVLDGGTGNDWLEGNDGADTLTGGTGSDTFWFGDMDSVGTTLDTITDFVSGADKIDLSWFGYSGSNYGEEVAGVAAANSALAGGITIVFDTTTKQLYVDADGSGVLDANDLVINMTGVTNLSATDFV
jgi:hypothetical protein